MRLLTRRPSHEPPLHVVVSGNWVMITGAGQSLKAHVLVTVFGILDADS